MTDEVRPDMSCVPYRRRGLYLTVTVPFFVLLVVVSAYLWTFSVALSIVFASFYFAMCYFQAYCCAYQDCPYIGGFCPGIAGIMPASALAKHIYSNREITRSRRAFQAHVALALAGWLGLIVFPLFWLAKLGVWSAIGYVACHAVYYAVFGLTVCPMCAIRNTCPGGRLQSVVHRR
jgi:hypothetical protein